MSRYTGPRVRAMRALGVQLPGLSSKSVERRPYPPGQHGQARRKVTEYGRRLMEKQKLCRNYGVSERQLRKLMSQARSSQGPTGSRLLELLERRLDNVVYRAGFARTIPGARQLVTHGHILVNGHKVDRASYSVRQGEVITLRAQPGAEARARRVRGEPSLRDGLAHDRPRDTLGNRRPAPRGRQRPVPD